MARRHPIPPANGGHQGDDERPSHRTEITSGTGAGIAQGRTIETREARVRYLDRLGLDR